MMEADHAQKRHAGGIEMKPLEPRLLRLSAAAAYLGVSVSTVYDLVDRGVLNPLTLPGVRGPRFDRADIEAMIERAKTDSAVVAGH